MDNRCMIIMPPGEVSGYPPGHFNRVYDYVIVPACRVAGLWPVRPDQAENNPMKVVQDIIDCNVLVCDLSGGNSDALYGLSIRSSLNLPVTPIKDLKTFLMFDSKEFGLVEYDESLRIDTVQKEIDDLGKALKNASENKKDRHAILNTLNIGLTVSTPPAFQESLPESAPEPKEPEPKAPPLPLISPLPEYVGDPFSEAQIEKMKPGDLLFHLVHGRGKINSVKKSNKDKLANIQFESGPKLLVVTPGKFFRQVND